MKYLIFSDSHLTPHFDERKFKVLKDAIEQADKVIINGDFWEGFNSSFEAFIQSKWNTTLFPLLKKKKSVYLYGNHDKKVLKNYGVELFSEKQDFTHTFKSGDNTYHVEHGDRLLALPDLSFLTLAMAEGIERILLALFGQMYIKVVYGRMNDKIKHDIKGKYKENEFLITGHTHCAEIDLKNHYINSGFNKYGRAQYIFIEDGVVTSIMKKY